MKLRFPVPSPDEMAMTANEVIARGIGKGMTAEELSDAIKRKVEAHALDFALTEEGKK